MEEDEDNNWELGLALETALQEEDGGQLERALEICKGRRIPSHLRAQVWQLCLGVEEYTAKLPIGSDIFDLPEQQELRNDSTRFVENFGNDEEDRVSIASDLESVLTGYCKSTGISYETGCGWLDVLQPLVTLRVSAGQLFQCFRAVMKDYVPRDVGNPEGLPFHIFRLLLLYHDPTLCSVLDSKRITSNLYASQWFRTMFASSCTLEGTLALWDVYFQFRDPFLIFHLGLALVLNAKERVLEMKDSESKEAILELLRSLPGSLEPADVPDFITIAQHYSTATPYSYRRMFETALFGSESFLTFGGTGGGSTSPSRRVAMQSLCMPISAEELLQSIRLARSLALQMESGLPSASATDLGVRFFVVDCRPAEQYNAGHLPTAFHLDCGLMLQEPVQFSTAVQGLLLAQKEALAVGSAAGGEHLCFVGSGREEEDQYMHMVVSSFLQRHTCKVALISGGYQALHELLSPDPDEGLSDHDASLCLECISGSGNETRASSAAGTPMTEGATSRLASTSKSLFSSFGTSLKAKSAEMKEKLIEYIVNPTGSTEERHVRSSDRNKKPYRNMANPFSISSEDASEEGAESDERVGEHVSLKAWQRKKSVLGSFNCSEVMANGEHYVGYVLVTANKIFMLRETEERDIAEVSVCRLLSTVIKITSKKKHPQLITFKYGAPEGDSVLITHCDRFYLTTQAKEFVALVKKQIDSRQESPPPNS